MYVFEYLFAPLCSRTFSEERIISKFVCTFDLVFTTARFPISSLVLLLLEPVTVGPRYRYPRYPGYAPP